FENVYFVKELKYNLFSVSQICDNKNSVLFTDSKCLVLGKDFKLNDDTNGLVRTPRQHNMYSIDLSNIVPHKNLTCLVAKASVDERKQHKASCKTKLVNFVSKPLHTLHMDLFGPTSVSSLNHKWYCLVVTDDFSMFTWTFFLRTKDETSSILRNFITKVENLKDLKVKIIRVLVNKYQNKTPYELFNSRIPAIGFLRPFGCHVMILNTLDHFGKFDAKGDEDVASQAVKKDVSSLRYIALPNYFHEAHMETSNDTIRNSDAQDDSQNEQDCNADVPESSVIFNPTATLKVPSANQVEPAVSLTVEYDILTVSLPVPTVFLDNSPESSSGSRLISKRVFSQEEAPSLGN
nr:hypothetical protein [Tanacetum cinerariifolium]